MIDVIFEVRDLVGRLIVYSGISITLEIFAGLSNIGGTIITRGMVTNYGKPDGETYLGYPKDFHGEQLVLPIGDATVKISEVEIVTD